MAGTRTPNFAFTALGEGENPTGDDWKFYNHDRYLLDALLNRALRHLHDGSAGELLEPSTAPSLELDTTSGGVLPAGRRIFYRYSLVDQYGTESAASPVSYLDLPEPIDTPGAPVNITTQTTGGTHLPGTYYYKLSAYVGANTVETRTGDPQIVIIQPGTSTNQIGFNLPTLPTGADGFNVYRKKPGGDYGYLTSIPAAEVFDQFVDDNTITDDCLRRLPVTNTTGGSNAVLVTLPGATPTVPEGYTWKIYRTYDDASWSSTFIVHVVEETTEGSGIITPEYLDLGVGTQAGTPLEESPQFPVSELIDLTTSVTGELPLGRVAHIDTPEFHVEGPVTVAAGVKQWVCEHPVAFVLWARGHLDYGSTPAVDPVTYDVVTHGSAGDTVLTPIDATVTEIPAGENIGERAAFDPTAVGATLFRGESITVDVTQAGGGATPTDSGLSVTVFILGVAYATTPTQPVSASTWVDIG